MQSEKEGKKMWKSSGMINEAVSASKTRMHAAEGKSNSLLPIFAGFLSTIA